MKLIPKILLSILTTAALLFAGFFVLLFTALSGGLIFHQVMVVALFAVAWLFLLMQIWKLLKPKVRYITLAAMVGIMLVSVAGFEINRAYHNSVEQINEQGVNLSLYDPFRDDTLAATLSEPSTLTLTDNLPRLDGATALYPVYSAFVKAVYPADYENFVIRDGDVEVKDGVITPELVKPEAYEILACTNTDGAYRRLIMGETDIIFVAGPSEGQLQMARDAGVELTLTPIGQEAFVFFVNAQNPVNGLSINDIRRIYSGEITNWREFGGKNTKIRAFQRPENSGSQTALIGFMGDTPLMTPPSEDVAAGMGGIINRVSSYRNYDNAIGYSFLYFATEMVNDNKIKLLELNGVAPTRENVANKTYPYASEFYAVTARTDNPNADRLIEWILSEQGQYLVEKTGYTPLAGTEKAAYKKITADEAAVMMAAADSGNTVVILDVRTQEEFDAGHIKDAILLPDFEIKDKAEMTLASKSETILVYCRTGRRSEAAAKELIAMGYANVYDFGGIVDWKREIVK